jgi:hypothetical protein
MTVSECLLRKNMSLSAMIFPRTLPMHFSSCIRRYALRSELSVLLGFGSAIAMVMHYILGQYPILTHLSIRE